MNAGDAINIGTDIDNLSAMGKLNEEYFTPDELALIDELYLEIQVKYIEVEGIDLNSPAEVDPKFEPIISRLQKVYNS